MQDGNIIADLGQVCRGCQARYNPNQLGRWRMELDSEQVCSWRCIENVYRTGGEALTPWGEATIEGMIAQTHEHGYQSLLDWCASADGGK